VTQNSRESGFIKVTRVDDSDMPLTPHSVSQNKIGVNTSNEAFKANYSKHVRDRTSTLMLKTSFHLINVILMGLCKVLKTIEGDHSKKHLVSETHKINIE
jgi:hypothetical protein